MPPAVPLATYRLQLTKDFGFDDAAALVPYLKALGISHLYASPFLKARAGQHARLRHRRSRPAQSRARRRGRLCALDRRAQGARPRPDPRFRAQPHGRRQRTTPGGSTCWNGARSRPTRRPSTSTGSVCRIGTHAGVLLPILGRPYGEALQAGEIELRFDAETGSFAAWYFEHKLPINPQRYDEIMRTAVAAAGAGESAAGRALLALADEYRDPEAPSYREAPELKRASRASRARHSDCARPAAYRADNEPGTARCIACSSGSIIALPIGASPSRQSITGASSTSTILPACASKTRRTSAPSIGWWRA